MASKKQLEELVQKHLGNTAVPEGFTSFINAVSSNYGRYETKIGSLEKIIDGHAIELAALNKKLLQEAEELKTTHQELTRIFNQVNEGFFTRDIIENRYLHMSVGCEKIYGYSIEEFFANNLLWYQVIHPDDKIIIDDDYESFSKGLPTTSAYRIIHRDTNIRWIEVKAIPVIADGKLVRVDGVVNDITERKQAEIRLINSEAKYRSFFENNMDGILLSKPNGSILEVNPAACEIFRASAAQICALSRDEQMLFAGPELPAMREERNRTGSFKGEIHFTRLDGTDLMAEIASGLFKDAHGEDRSFIIIRDITERKNAEKKLIASEHRYRTLFEELRRKNTELEQFAYVASHDLQEPLRTTTSFVQLLLQQYQGKLDDKADKYFHFIVESVDRMKNLITDLLDYSRIGNKVQMEQVDCNKILHIVTDDLYKAIQETGAEISTGDLPLINGYPGEIKQLFQNLLTNAIKFRKPGTTPQIKITAGRNGADWLFSFADNGIGINKAHKDKIFIIFQRLHTRSEYEGSGIGLSHCKKIVELHHGKIWVESTPGEGSIFYFTMPAETTI